MLLSLWDLANTGILVWVLGKVSTNGDEVTFAFDSMAISMTAGFFAVRIIQDVLAIILGVFLARLALKTPAK